MSVERGSVLQQLRNAAILQKFKLGKPAPVEVPSEAADVDVMAQAGRDAKIDPAADLKNVVPKVIVSSVARFCEGLPHSDANVSEPLPTAEVQSSGRGQSRDKAPRPRRSLSKESKEVRPPTQGEGTKVHAPSSQNECRPDSDCGQRGRSRAASTPCQPPQSRLIEESVPPTVGSIRKVPLKEADGGRMPQTSADDETEVGFEDSGDEDSKEEAMRRRRRSRSRSPCALRAGEHLSTNRVRMGQATPPRSSPLNPFALSHSELADEKRKIRLEEQASRIGRRRSLTSTPTGKTHASSSRDFEKDPLMHVASPLRRSTPVRTISPLRVAMPDILQEKTQRPTSRTKKDALTSSSLASTLAALEGPERALKAHIAARKFARAGEEVQSHVRMTEVSPGVAQSQNQCPSTTMGSKTDSQMVSPSAIDAVKASPQPRCMPTWVSWSLADLQSHGSDEIRFRAQNPRRHGSKAWQSYESYKVASTVAEFLSIHGKHLAAKTWKSDALHGVLEVASQGEALVSGSTYIQENSIMKNPASGDAQLALPKAVETRPSPNKSPMPKRPRQRSKSGDSAPQHTAERSRDANRASSPDKVLIPVWFGSPEARAALQQEPKRYRRRSKSCDSRMQRDPSPSEATKTSESLNEVATAFQQASKRYRRRSKSSSPKRKLHAMTPDDELISSQPRTAEMFGQLGAAAMPEANEVPAPNRDRPKSKRADSPSHPSAPSEERAAAVMMPQLGTSETLTQPSTTAVPPVRCDGVSRPLSAALPDTTGRLGLETSGPRKRGRSRSAKKDCPNTAPVGAPIGDDSSTPIVQEQKFVTPEAALDRDASQPQGLVDANTSSPSVHRSVQIAERIPKRRVSCGGRQQSKPLFTGTVLTEHSRALANQSRQEHEANSDEGRPEQPDRQASVEDDLRTQVLQLLKQQQEQHLEMQRMKEEKEQLERQLLKMQEQISSLTSASKEESAKAENKRRISCGRGRKRAKVDEGSIVPDQAGTREIVQGESLVDSSCTLRARSTSLEEAPVAGLNRRRLSAGRSHRQERSAAHVGPAPARSATPAYPVFTPPARPSLLSPAVQADLMHVVDAAGQDVQAQVDRQQAEKDIARGRNVTRSASQPQCNPFAGQLTPARSVTELTAQQMAQQMVQQLQASANGKRRATSRRRSPRKSPGGRRILPDDDDEGEQCTPGFHDWLAPTPSNRPLR